MNSKAQTWAVFLFVGFLFVIVLFATIEPFKESLDNTRGTTSLNCPGTDNFNGTNYANQTKVEKLTRRTTCFATGLSMVWFVGAFLFALGVWITSQIRKSRRK